MRLAHRRAAWALVAAGSLGMALSALAQQPVKPASDSKTPTTETAAAMPADVSPGEARLAEIKAEVAWLADPVTFPCQLAAHKVGSVLEVGGFVPNEGLRQRALDLARKDCPLTVVDKLIVHPNSTLPTVPDTHDHLCKSAATVLGKTLSQFGERFEFSADARGQITIVGLIPSWEEKLNVSRRLSQLPGCTAVTNSFVVKSTLQDGKQMSLVSADGHLWVPAQGNQTVEFAPSMPPRVEVVQRAAVPVNAPVTTVSAFGQPAAPVSMLPAQRPMPVSPAPVAAPYVVKTQPVSPAPMPAPYVVKTQPVIVQATTNPPRPQPVVTQPAVQQVVYQVPAQGESRAPTVVQAAATTPYGASPYATPYVTKPAPQQAVRQAPTQVMPAPLPQNLANAPTIAPRPATPQLMPGQVARPVGGVTPTAAVTPAVAVSSPAARWAAPPAAPAAPAAPVQAMTPQVQVQVLRRIEALSGGAVRDARIQCLANNQCVIQLKVRSKDEAQVLGQKVLNLPELAPYKVDLDVKIQP